MKKYKILNLYACLGGNRYKWDEVAKEAEIEIEVTAVELDEELARLYQERFPNDTVIIADAHQYLLDHYKEFDFIWSSPPCPTHSGTNHFLNALGVIRYPDMKLYEEIIFLDTFFKGKYVVENVIPYYKPLIEAKKRERHLYWTNFNLPNILSNRVAPNMNMNTKSKGVNKAFLDYHNITDLVNDYKGKQDKGKIARNLVDYEAGKTILQTALNIQKKENVNQLDIFDL
jgi:DNA (cytosine-5)-methyltransferase 1